MNLLQATAKKLGTEERGVILRSLLLAGWREGIIPETNRLVEEYNKKQTVCEITHHYCLYILSGGRP